MHIRRVTIDGFRSYRNATEIEEFSSSHNVIVGRNGSGKSNFFYAIQFVLSDEFSHLRSEQRQSLLHEGTGPRIQTAKVEIIFDNRDQRIPIEKEEVSLVRQVGAKKDQYFLDGKHVTRSEVVNLMESAGFSRSNPYYIVKQGKINELSTAPDPHRLKLLREVAGTRVYDERKEESKGILKDTETKRDNIEKVLRVIEQRLKTLEEEKEELKEYQIWDKKKRSLEYTMYDRELQEARKKYDKYAEEREELLYEKNQLQSEFNDLEEEIQSLDKERTALNQRFEAMREERSGLRRRHEEAFDQKTRLELDINDVREELDRGRRNREQAEGELENLKESITEKEDRLRTIDPEFRRLVEEETRAKTELATLKQRQGYLYNKTGQREQFDSVDARDRWLAKEVRTIDKQIQEKQRQIDRLNQEINKEREEDEAMQKKLAEVNHKLLECRSDLEASQSDFNKSRAQREQLLQQRDDLFREENVLLNESSNLTGEINNCDAQMRSLSSKSIMNGLRSVEHVLKTFRERGGAQHEQLLDGYHGILIDLFHCGEKFFRAVEVVVGNRLFFHVVDTDRISLKILDEINKQKLPGEVNFFPLNRIDMRDTKYPEGDRDVVPMIHQLQYDDQYDRVMKHIFGRILICRSLEKGLEVGKKERLDCVTLDGDTISSRGTMQGGYNDLKQSRLKLKARQKELIQQKEEKEGNMSEVKRKIDEVTAKMNSVSSEYTKQESSSTTNRSSFNEMTNLKRDLERKLLDADRNKEPKLAQLRDVEQSMTTMRSRRRNFEDQQGSELQSQLTDDEQGELEAILEQLTQLNKHLADVSAKRSRLEEEKNQLSNNLRQNLLRKRASLQSKTQDISVETQRHQLQAQQGELENTNKKLTEISRRLSELDGDLSEYNEENDRLQSELEGKQERHRTLEEEINRKTKEIDRIAQNQAFLTQKREEAMRKVRELGSLPSDAFEKYQNLSGKQLEKRLNECVKELKKYEHVNKKALDQFVTFSEQKEKLVRRKTEIDRGHKAIMDLMHSLEHQKYEAIQLTFKMVAQYFEEVFLRLVPNGKAHLVMVNDPSKDTSKRSSRGAAASVEDDERMDTDDGSSTNGGAPPPPSYDDFVGVGIRVSFTGHDETKEMNQLSGGQKSLVALALIFAIQKCDPAPFYLFDEIDAALDAQHRKEVADMIHDLSQSAQFITTTFRPELLENADKYYGVRFRNKVSYIECVTREAAYDFVEDDATHG